MRGVLGDWVYYCALMNAGDISKRIHPSHEIREAKALEDFLQRELKTRVEKIAAYLLRRDSRFFNSIVVGVFDALPSWAEFDLEQVEEEVDRATKDEINESVGLLIFTGKEKMFAIDGQHRVEGIKLAYSTDHSRIGPDQYPVIFVAHLDTPIGKMRTRRLFCDINKNAVPVSEGDKVVIDEDDLCAIVARRVYANYGPFRGGAEIAVTERKEVLAKDGKERFTSLLALYTVVKKLKRLFRKSPQTLDSDPSNVSRLEAIVADFFDYVIDRDTSLRKYFREENTSLSAEREHNRNLFFRPVGLEILARLYVHFKSRNNLPRFAHGMSKIDFLNPGGLFDGVLWRKGKVFAKSKEKAAAVDLCLYVLGELDTVQIESLLKRLREITDDAGFTLPTKVGT